MVALVLSGFIVDVFVDELCNVAVRGRGQLNRRVRRAYGGGRTVLVDRYAGEYRQSNGDSETR